MGTKVVITCGVCGFKGHNRRTCGNPQNKTVSQKKKRVQVKNMSTRFSPTSTSKVRTINQVNLPQRHTKDSRGVKVARTVELTLPFITNQHGNVYVGKNNQPVTKVSYMPVDKQNFVKISESFVKKFYKVTTIDRKELFIDEKGQPHHSTQPAYVNFEKNKAVWFDKGIVHNLNGPAITTAKEDEPGALLVLSGLKRWVTVEDVYVVNGVGGAHPKLCEAITSGKIPTVRLFELTQHDDVVVVNLATHQLVKNGSSTPEDLRKFMKKANLCPQLKTLISEKISEQYA